MAKLSKNLTNIVVLVVVAAIVVAGGYYVFFNGPDNKTVTARFSSAVGIYSGTPVRILGVNVGEVTEVKPTGGYVAVTMEYDPQYKVPANAGALAVANSLVSDRYIQLTPVYRSGTAMATGAIIPTNRTGAPSELDDIYSALNKLSVALGPKGANSTGALNSLVTVAAANLKGNGAALGNSISKLSQAAQTLSNSRGDLFGTVRNLQKFTTTLKSSDTQVRLFNRQLAQVAGDLAAERGDLGAALQQLGLALDAVGGFVKKNAGKFHTDIRGLRSILGTVVKQRASLNETLAVAPVALANLIHTYDPVPGVIASRGNIASLTNISLPSICGALTSVLLGGSLGAPIPLDSLGGNIKTVCKSLPKAPGATSNASSPGSGNPSSPLGPSLVGGTP